ncbi:TonB-dependent receptor [Sphingobium sufflavum]|uniref:TonB-dependent receptor n=1 Tax=Sphingobium sufflavum TaxID=1129547 RepID=UPI001F16B119|nr:TonB-dependent receptor [Sphingobium sufflavum]MCE7797438.1 TonB-dependent receptor [Sphingobium sufflavum]
MPTFHRATELHDLRPAHPATSARPTNLARRRRRIASGASTLALGTLTLGGLSLLLLTPATPARAQSDQTARTGRTQPTRTAHSHDDGAEIIVSAPIRQSERDVLSGTTVVTGEKLERDLRSTIGETLARQPGVSASSFGPNASRPILRGFQGERVRVLSDGIGSIDVSNTSADHAVVIDPLLAERVEVMRGPAALLFGSSAAGGVVNVLDRRIPRAMPENGYRFDGMATYGSAASERSVGGTADVAVGPHIVLNANGSYLRTSDLRIGGHVLSAPARAAALAAAAGPTTPDDPDFAATASLRDRLPNSAAETWTAGFGGAVVTDTANVGIAYSHYDSLYGVPIRYATASGQEQESPRLSVVQNRIDVRADVAMGDGFFERIRVRGAYAAYRHYELDEDGAIGTTFKSKGLEGRVELVQAHRGGWTGASGVQYFNRAFKVAGDEAFLPNNLTSQVGLFTLQQLDLGKLKIEGGLRYEKTDQRATADGGTGRFFDGRRSFDAVSGSVGASYALAQDVRAGLNVSRTERAPSAEELFANGPHAGTQAWELGNPDFRVEKAWTVEATLHIHKPGFGFDASVYHSWFADYIGENQVDQGICEAAAAPSGRDVDLPCFQFRQGRARYYGAEADMTLLLGRVGGYALNLDLVGDYVHASGRTDGTDNSPLPRIPPARLLGGLEAQSDRLTGRVEVEHSFAQSRIAQFETRTDGYTLVNASVSWRPVADNGKFSLLLSGNNLFDVDARRASSVLKDFAPLAGRDIRVTARVGF